MGDVKSAKLAKEGERGKEGGNERRRVANQRKRHFILSEKGFPPLKRNVTMSKQ